MLRKRYTVVVVGEGGMALAQRSEVSRHRSERDARAAAEEARGRLTVMHGDGAGSYRVVIERDGIALDDDMGPRPAILDLDLERDAPEVLRATPDPPEGVRVIRGPAADDGEEGGETAEQPALFGDLDAAGDAELEELLEDAPSGGDADAPGAGSRPRDRDHRPRMPTLDDIPSGRVPDDVLRRFEEAIAREERRRAQRPPGGAG
ncbi:MAG: hypothetical protein IT200_12445 [Thermoleophilia bacterium]|nr:hypothetical protein [Thermoleophilia bacterium]